MELPSYPSTNRNRMFITNILSLYLPKKGYVLETASGTGEHIVYFGRQFPYLKWQPSDKSSDLFWAVRERVKKNKYIEDPIVINLKNIGRFCDRKQYDAMLNINMIHIAPWEACSGLFLLAEKIITEEGFVYLYGPFKVKGLHTSMSNEKFDISLRERNPDWGVRNIEDVINIAKRYGFLRVWIYDMPANNKSVVFKKK